LTTSFPELQGERRKRVEGRGSVHRLSF